MMVTGPMILAPDVILLPVAALPGDLPRRLRAASGDHALAHRRSRTPPRIVDEAGAALLQRFRQPGRIVDAILAFSRDRQEDPVGVLRASFPLLREAVNAGFLVPADTSDALRIRPSLEPGARVAGVVVQDCLQLLADSEVYRVRRSDGSPAALKMVRPGHSPATLRHEAAVLAQLDLPVVPRLLGTGQISGRPYLLTEWRAGADPDILAEEYRQESGDRGRARLLRLCRRIVAAYARLHARGVVHGDVHPRNLVVEARGRVAILDFGSSRFGGPQGEVLPPARGGVGEFIEPEYAAAMRARRAPPSPTPESDQYSVAALLYYLATGGHYRTFAPRESEMFREIAEHDPLPFSAHGVPLWPGLEAVLGRALAKRPGDRFPSLAAFGHALRRVAGRPQRGRQRVTPRSRADALRDILGPVGLQGQVLAAGRLERPSASASLGAAGIAYGLYRIASTREDPRLFAAADIWLERALGAAGRREEWWARPAGITPRVVGKISPYHAPAGVFWVQALMSRARGDAAAQHAAVKAFVKASRASCRNPDLVLGRAGTLLACALLREAMAGDLRRDRAAIGSLGREISAALLDGLRHAPPLGQCRRFPNLGLAHGWAGILYAILRWCESGGTRVPPAVSDRLGELAECARPSGRGVVWPWRSRSGGQVRSHGHMPGWCNGSAGFVFLWSLADQLEGEDRYLALAERAGLEAWTAPDPAWDLCCGYSGRGFALLNLYKRTGEPCWLHRARRVGEQAVRRAREEAEGEHAYPYSLFRGRLGLATLLGDLDRPDDSCFPLFEGEGWRRVVPRP
jgi:serine/threonine-protein kinase